VKLAMPARGVGLDRGRHPTVGWIIFLAVAIPLLVVVGWVVFEDSFVRIEPGHLGLLLIHGRATDRSLDPGPHWVPALRRRMVQTYPSLELTFRAGDAATTAASELERGGPAPLVTLGDRLTAVVCYTVRFRLDREVLREVHNRFGPDGLWAAVRDETARTVRASLADPSLGLDDLFGSARAGLEERLTNDVTTALAALGFVVTMFSLGDLDLGRTGEVIQATARARHELEREEAEAAMRMARVRIDADLAPYLASPATEAAIRYREVDSWQELARATGFARQAMIRAGAPETPAAAGAPSPEPPAEEAQ
jgi:regulator of protease activity HflC (stomatin/prohibitin superfamily)